MTQPPTSPTQPQSQPPTTDEVRSLSEKLKVLDQTLSDGERLALRSIVSAAFRPQQDGDDVRGYEYEYEVCPLQHEWWDLLDWTCNYWH